MFVHVCVSVLRYLQPLMRVAHAAIRRATVAAGRIDLAEQHLDHILVPLLHPRQQLEQRQTFLRRQSLRVLGQGHHPGRFARDNGGHGGGRCCGAPRHGHGGGQLVLDGMRCSCSHSHPHSHSHSSCSYADAVLHAAFQAPLPCAAQRRHRRHRWQWTFPVAARQLRRQQFASTRRRWHEVAASLDTRQHQLQLLVRLRHGLQMRWRRGRAAPASTRSGRGCRGRCGAGDAAPEANARDGRQRIACRLPRTAAATVAVAVVVVAVVRGLHHSQHGIRSVFARARLADALAPARSALRVQRRRWHRRRRRHLLLLLPRCAVVGAPAHATLVHFSVAAAASAASAAAAVGVGVAAEVFKCCRCSRCVSISVSVSCSTLAGSVQFGQVR